MGSFATGKPWLNTHPETPTWPSASTDSVGPLFTRSVLCTVARRLYRLLISRSPLPPRPSRLVVTRTVRHVRLLLPKPAASTLLRTLPALLLTVSTPRQERFAPASHLEPSLSVFLVPTEESVLCSLSNWPV